MEQTPLEQQPTEQLPPKIATSYLGNLSIVAERYFGQNPERAEILEVKGIQLSARAIFNHLADKPHLQQKLADRRSQKGNSG
jgi:hypothetical protein